MEVLILMSAEFLFMLQNALYIPLLHVSHPDATGDAERGGNRREDAEGNLKDGFPSFFLHNRKFFLMVSHRRCHQSHLHRQKNRRSRTPGACTSW